MSYILLCFPLLLLTFLGYSIAEESILRAFGLRYIHRIRYRITIRNVNSVIYSNADLKYSTRVELQRKYVV